MFIITSFFSYRKKFYSVVLLYEIHCHQVQKKEKHLLSRIYNTRLFCFLCICVQIVILLHFMYTHSCHLSHCAALWFLLLGYYKFYKGILLAFLKVATVRSNEITQQHDLTPTFQLSYMVLAVKQKNVTFVQNVWRLRTSIPVAKQDSMLVVTFCVYLLTPCQVIHGFQKSHENQGFQKYRKA